MQITLWDTDFSFFKHVSRSGWSRDRSPFNFLRNHHTDFFSGCNSLQSPPMVQLPFSLHPRWCLLSLLFYYAHPHLCGLIVVLIVRLSTLPCTCWPCVCLWKKMPIQVHHPVLNSIMCFFAVEFILWRLLLIRFSLQIFSSILSVAFFTHWAFPLLCWSIWRVSVRLWVPGLQVKPACQAGWLFCPCAASINMANL